MSSQGIERVVTESFGMDPSLEGDTLSVRLTGTGDMAAAAPLGGFLRAAQDEVRRRSLATVEFDVRALHFLNSSCLKAFITFIASVGNEGLGCKIRFLTDAKLEWQRRSLSALQRMSPDRVTITSA